MANSSFVESLTYHYLNAVVPQPEKKELVPVMLSAEPAGS